MLNQQTLDKLVDMKLHGMVEAWQEQSSRPEFASLSFDERFGLLVDREHLLRDNRRLTRLLRAAQLKMSQACIEEIDYAGDRSLDRSLVLTLDTCQYIEDQLGILITGPTGTGKTFMACAFGQKACRRGYRVLYRRASRLYDELRLARAEGTYAKLLKRLARLDVLIIDDFALTPMRESERGDLLEVMEDRFSTRSTIVTSQLPAKHFHDYLGDPTLADALCERLLRRCYRIELTGKSRRPEAPEG